ncbi:MAG: ARMT1-like domain-containing protein [Kiritimatiellales bacterium]
MNTTLHCIPCFVRQTLDACRMVTDDPALHEQIMRDVLRWMSEMDLSLSPPELAQRIHRRLRELTGVEDPYRKQKDEHNQMALKLLPGLRTQVAASDDSLMTATHLAIAGNIIDLGAKSGLAENEVQDAILHASEKPLEGDLETFRKEVARAGTILYLTDNCGEIVFDTLLIEQLGAKRVTLAVRGRPIINDATPMDAKTAGLNQIVPVIGNGSDAPGTLIEDCSEEFRKAFDSADLIISKGQGNFETLNDCGKNIFFLLKVKCPVVAESVCLPVGTHILRHGKNLL